MVKSRRFRRYRRVQRYVDQCGAQLVGIGARDAHGSHARSKLCPATGSLTGTKGHRRRARRSIELQPEISEHASHLADLALIAILKLSKHRGLTVIDRSSEASTRPSFALISASLRLPCLRACATVPESCRDRAAAGATWRRQSATAFAGIGHVGFKRPGGRWIGNALSAPACDSSVV